MKSATYLLLEMELCLHKRMQASHSYIFYDYSAKLLFHFRLID